MIDIEKMTSIVHVFRSQAWMCSFTIAKVSVIDEFCV